MAPSLYLKGIPIEIRPASLAQISAGRNGQMIQIDDDVQGVANGLAELDSHIRLRFSEAGGHFVVYWEGDDDSGYVITTAQELDQRILKRVEKIVHDCRQPGYSFAKELEKAEASEQAKREHEAAEARGPALEQLAHAMRKDTGHDKQKIFVPEGVK